VLRDDTLVIEQHGERVGPGAIDADFAAGSHNTPAAVGHPFDEGEAVLVVIDKYGGYGRLALEVGRRASDSEFASGRSCCRLRLVAGQIDGALDLVAPNGPAIDRLAAV
jgi:hypothetical protein